MDESDTPPDAGSARPAELDGTNPTSFLSLTGTAPQGPFPYSAPGPFGNLPGAPGTPVPSPIGAILGNPGALAPFSGFAPPADGTPQFAPQGVLGNLIGDPGKPGFPFGGPVPGTQIGSVAGQLGRYLPFSVHPFGSGAPGATPPPEEDPPAS